MNAVPAIAAALLAGASAAYADDSAPTAAAGPPTVTVVGEATEDAKPDIASFTLSVEVEKPTAADAASEDARRAQAVIAGLTAAGVADKDISTTGLSLNPVWSSGSNRNVSGYQAINRLTVKAQPIDKVGPLIAAAVAAGAEYQSLGFDASDRAAREDALRVKAVENAAHRAELYARGAAMKLGPLRSIYADATTPIYRPLAEPMRAMAGAAPAPPPIAPGQITLSETVTASWGLTAQ